MQSIAEAESVTAPSASGISQEEIDDLLRVGSNTDDARMKLATEFSKGKTPEELTAFVKQTYHGGYGIQAGYYSVSAWYAEDGIHLAHGRSAEHNSAALVLSWEDAAARIGELLEQGQFATNVELAEAPGFERRQLAESIRLVLRDVSKEGIEQGWGTLLEGITGSEEGIQLATALANPQTRSAFIEKYRQFVEEWRSNPKLLNSRHYRPVELLRRLDELELPRREYHSDMAEPPAVRHFITEDEINHVFSDAHDRLRSGVYLFWNTNHSDKEKADYLKQEYGIGGHNNAISHNFDSWMDHEGKGVKLKKPDCGEVQLSWAKVVQRIDKLIADGQYWTLADSIRVREGQQRAEQAQREAETQATPAKPQIPKPEITQERQNAAVRDYAAVKLEHPDDLVLYRVGDFYEMFGEDAERAAAVLDLTLTTRNIPDMGRVAMCGVPAHNLDLYVERLRDKYDVAIAGVSEQSGEFTVVTLPSIDHEAERAIDAQEAEYSADGFRAFRDEEQIAAAEAEPEYSDVEALAVADMNEYNALKERRPDDLVFYQIGDAFEVYGEDASKVAALLGVEQTTRALSGTGRVNAVVLPLMKHREYAPPFPKNMPSVYAPNLILSFPYSAKMANASLIPDFRRHTKRSAKQRNAPRTLLCQSSGPRQSRKRKN